MNIAITGGNPKGYNRSNWKNQKNGSRHFIDDVLQQMGPS
jgi:hypothetical protein